MVQPSLAGSDGNPTSSCWVIGRDYGVTEQRDRLPFQGESGMRLNDALGLAGMPRSTVFVDNIVREQPRGNQWAAHRPGAVEAGIARLHEQISYYQPKFILAVGAQAFAVCMGVDPDKNDLPNIRECRGYFWESPLGPRVMGVTHPAAIDRRGGGGLAWVPWMKLFYTDVNKAAAEVRAGCPPLVTREVEILNNEAQISKLCCEILSPKTRIALDIENYDDLSLACLGVAASHTRAWAIPTRHQWQLDLIWQICESDTPKVLQNGKYDRYFLRYLTLGDAARTRRYDITINNVVGDPMLAWHILEPELAGMKEDKKKGHKITRKSLAFLVSILLRDPWWKNYDFVREEERYTLCGRDCCMTLECCDILEGMLRGDS